MSDPYVTQAPPPPSPLTDGVVGHLPQQEDPYATRGRDLLADGADALARAQADKAQQRRTFTLGGQVFQFRAEVDARVMVALEREQLATALKLALRGGDADVDRLMEVDEPLTIDKFRALIAAWMESTGTNPGE